MPVSCTKSKPAARRRGAQILVNEEEDARLLDRCEAKKKEWAKHWGCDEEVQNAEEKPWMNEELRKLEEALQRLKECHMEDVSRLYKAKTGVGCDGFQWTYQKKREEKSWSSWRRWSKVDSGRNKHALRSRVRGRLRLRRR